MLLGEHEMGLPSHIDVEKAVGKAVQITNSCTGVDTAMENGSSQKPSRAPRKQTE